MSGAEGACPTGDVYVVSATMRRPAVCGVCGAALARGDTVRVGVDGANTARFVVCAACAPTAAMMAPVPATLAHATASHARGVLAWRERTIGLLDPERLFDAIARSLR